MVATVIRVSGGRPGSGSVRQAASPAVAAHQASHPGRLRSGGIDALGGEQVGDERP
jgi:hypothetical protein